MSTPDSSLYVDRFEDLDLAHLRQRKSEKWTRYPPHVLPAFVAEMDFAVAEPIRQALLNAIDLSDFGYAAGVGLADAFAEFAAREMHWTVTRENVCLMPDVISGVLEALRLLVPPGAGVVINTPAYPPYFSTLSDAGWRIVTVPLRYGELRWELDFDALEAAFASGARAYLLCSPHNPTGRVFTRQELETIGSLAARFNVAIVSDGVHGPLTLPGAAHIPFAALSDALTANSITITAASKAWNIAGLKCAVAVAGSREIGRRLAGLPDDVRDRAGHLGVLASIAAFREGGPWLKALLAHLDRNRTLLATLLDTHLPGISWLPPEASYLAWLDCRSLGFGDDPATRFRARGNVALSSGLSFGPEGTGFARLNFGTSTALLTEIVERMAAALS